MKKKINTLVNQLETMFDIEKDKQTYELLNIAKELRFYYTDTEKRLKYIRKIASG